MVGKESKLKELVRDKPKRGQAFKTNISFPINIWEMVGGLKEKAWYNTG